MAAKDDILRNPPQEDPDADKGTAAWSDQQQSSVEVNPDIYKGTVEWADQNSGENAPVISPTPTASATAAKDNKVGLDKINQQLGGGGGGGGSLNQPPSQEELERERKRARRSAIFSAIGDGVSALANLYFTSKGAISTYDPKSSMTAQVNDQWKKYLEDYDARKQAYIKNALAEQKVADAAAAQQALQQHRKEQAEAQERRWRERFKYDQDKDKADQDYKKQKDDRDFQERQRQFDENQKRLKNAAASANATRKEIAQATAARGRRGKRLGFSDNNGNEVGIYENVWKGSMQNVYDAIIEDGVIELSALQKYGGMTATKKDDFVKRNWTKSPRARAIMMTLAQIDPETMTSKVQNGEDYSQYQQQDEDYSQYEVK